MTTRTNDHIDHDTLSFVETSVIGPYFCFREEGEHGKNPEVAVCPVDDVWDHYIQSRLLTSMVYSYLLSHHPLGLAVALSSPDNATALKRLFIKACQETTTC